MHPNNTPERNDDITRMKMFVTTGPSSYGGTDRPGDARSQFHSSRAWLDLCGLFLSLVVQRFEDEFCSHGDCRFQTSINRASIREDPMHAGRGLPIAVPDSQSHPHMNTADHEHVLLEFDLAHSFADQASSRRANLTRLQRASEGSGESARRRGNNVV